MNNNLKINRQKGVVLIISLVFLIALTAVAAALMQNSTSDMKMSGASEEKTVAHQEVVSAVDEVIYNQITAVDNLFTRPATDENFPIQTGVLLPDTETQATATVDVVDNDYGLDTSCPRMEEGSSSNTFQCNILRISVNRVYGRKGNSNISAESGIVQQYKG